ncbi:MAG TPA: phage holin family protein [Acidimicrobiales bacterium]|nr:phage holin family protein [Acidimicrobiales bacterium]
MPETRLAPYSRNGDKTDNSVTAQISELWELIVAYAKQETVEPIKGLARFVGFGVLGSICLAIGLTLLLLATLRALQTETGSSMQGHLSWIPYVVTVVVAVVIAALAGMQIQKKRRG